MPAYKAAVNIHKAGEVVLEGTRLTDEFIASYPDFEGLVASGGAVEVSDDETTEA